MEALKKMRPLVEQAIQADPSKKPELLALISQAGGEIKGKQFSEASASLVALGKLLKSLVARPNETTAPTPVAESPPVAPPQNTPNEQAAEFARRCDVIQPQLQAARDNVPEKAEALSKVWQFAQDQASAQNFPAAFKALDRLEAALKDMVPQAQPTLDMKAWLAAKAAWQEAVETVDAQIADLQSALRAVKMMS